ncbi:uncharacterized protein BX663DRAFT_548181 [Cokeromyces recurvatus]|uniref:uncharacterized protein n=1 Tax=Cokeromyces recurvatus TaxID=90255 RepID=UPI00221EC416|nr:uncharacterized protein BX663DRAFT_548181 [Cokeromyces recurvatus]KAI7907099.1 hypothetical protein BX663DRAFT_548181 [Cokeromyces recurvatus]
MLNKLFISKSCYNLNSIRLFTTASKEPWLPKKRVSRETMEKIRSLARFQPEIYTVKQISTEFKLSFEAVKRILKSRYNPTQVVAERQERNRYKAMGERMENFKKTTTSSNKKE